MRNSIWLLFLFGLFQFCTSSTPNMQATLDGRTFKIESFTGGKSEGMENMIFKAGKVENDVCTQWGFSDAPYTYDPKSGVFKYTLTSASEGRMDWEGTVSANAVSGKMVWVKAGQNDIHYTFQGAEEPGGK